MDDKGLFFHPSKSFFRIFFAALFILALCLPVMAILQNGSIKIFAVTEDNKGMAADLFMYTIPGSGKAAFITSNSLVGKDTQTTGNIALQLAQSKTGVKLSDKDVIFDIRANASEVDGPSAGAAMTLLSYSMLSEKPLPSYVGMTGTINPDGSVGVVGGVGLKAFAASETGIKLFIIPSGEAVTEVDENGSLETVNLLEYGPRKLGMTVVEVSTIDQAIQYAYSNIDEIKVDTNISSTIFVPNAITYSNGLSPMEQISQDYIAQTKGVIDDAKKELEHSDLDDSLRIDLYQSLAASQRSVEMARRFLDQNYLYSSANYAFNSRVSAGTVKEIAENPSILSSGSTVLDSKISTLRSDIQLLKEQMGFVSPTDFEWVVGAQQRVAYAEGALNNLYSENPDSSGSQQDQQSVYYRRVYDYVSAQAWTEVAKEFLTEGRKSNPKAIPVYTSAFTEMVRKKIADTEKLIKDSNSTSASIQEATRRLSAAKISFDSNFLFASLYDTYFAESFILSEKSRQFFSLDELMKANQKSFSDGLGSDSIWAGLYFDHAKFYNENALFNSKISRTQEMEQSAETSFDLIFLSKRIVEAKTLVSGYISTTKMPAYVERTPSVSANYGSEGDAQYLVFLSMAFIAVMIVLLFLTGVASRFARPHYHPARREKVRAVLGNLDRALSRKKISKSEYFFMKRHYEQELKHGDLKNVGRRHEGLTAEDLRSKRRALEHALVDLRRHFKSGLVVSEDFESNYKEVKREIEEITSEIMLLSKSKKQAQSDSSIIGSIKGILFPAPKIKGTKELAAEEEEEQLKERAKRKKS